MEMEERQDSPKAGEAGASGSGGAEQRCPICLEAYEDKAFVDPCFHAYCFACIVQWSEVTNTCPVCKTCFNSVVHNVKIDNTYSKFEVKSTATSSTQEVSLSEARRFRYRTTGGEGGGRSRGRPRPRQTRKPAIEERRRAVYATGLRAVAPTTTSRQTRVRNITASFYRDNPAATHRLLPWLSREIRVLLGPEHVEFMIQIVLSLIDKVDLEGVEFATHLEPYLHERTDHFLHELVTFAKSPFDMIAYDNSVSYNWPQHLSHHRLPVDSTTAAIATPGPSAEAMQQRILQELASTRWDDSPPLMPTTSADSPILIHGSDSEDAGQSHSHTSSPIVVSPVHSESGMETQNVTTQQPLDNHVTNNRTSGSPASQDLSEHATSRSGLGDLRTRHSKEEEDEEICLFAEDSLIDNGEECSSAATSSHKRRRKGKDSGRSSFKSKGNSLRERERDNHKHHRRHHSSSLERTRHSSSSRDRSSHCSSSSRRRHHAHGSRSRERGKEAKKHPKMERDDASSLGDDYCRRESDRHRSRLYSDDITPREKRKSDHQKRRKSHKKQDSSTDEASLSGDDASSQVRSKVVVAGSSQLVQELESVDERLKDNKKQLLKSLLRKERIQLLHRNLHGETLEEKEEEEEGARGEGKLEEELVKIDRAIASEKRELLHVLRRMEDEFTQDSDHN